MWPEDGGFYCPLRRGDLFEATCDFYKGGGQVLGRRPLAVKEKKIPAAAAAAAADGVRAPSSAEKQNIETHEMAKEHVLKKKQQHQNVYPRLVWSIFLFIYFF